LRIRVNGAKEHNLKNVDVEIRDGLTVVTGVSGSGKTSLIFDTIYQEAQRRFEEAFSHSHTGPRLTPARVDSIVGLGPAVAVGQNVLNRNPHSSLATASGLHPFLRLLYARFGDRHCPNCDEKIQVVTGDQLIELIQSINSEKPVTVYALLLRNAVGSHRTLLRLLEKEFGSKRLLVDGTEWDIRDLNSGKAHSVEVEVAKLVYSSPVTIVKEAVETSKGLGADTINIRSGGETHTFSTKPVCSKCGYWFSELRPQHFHQTCPHCGGDGCDFCRDTGLHPEASTVTYAGLRFPELMKLSVDEAANFFEKYPPESAHRLGDEIVKRLEALGKVGLGYLSLDRPSPSLSRGESQRVRLAVILTSRLEDVLHVLDEPTIGQHPYDVSRLIPTFRELGGPVLYVEHDRLAASEADYAVEIGPGAGTEGGEITFTGTPGELWASDTVTGRYFSLRERVKTPEIRQPPNRFITVRGAHAHNLKDITFSVPLGRLTVVTGVSGSGKSTLVEDVLAASLFSKQPMGCSAFEGPSLKPVMVDQGPIGRNPRSTPATYTKLSDVIRDLYAEWTGLSPSHFSFNRPEGACPTCNGMGAVEVKMRYLQSSWVTCADCEGRRYSDEVLEAKVKMGNRFLSIANFYDLSILEAYQVLLEADLDPKRRKRVNGILGALIDIGLGYLSLGQASPTLSGGEAQRVKLAKYLGRGKLRDRLLVLDEPSTGLHPSDISDLLVVLDRLVKSGATVVVVEHNTDIIRAADWVIDLGPGAGPFGGEVLYMGDYAGLDLCTGSLTAEALGEEDQLVPC
jgi:excinuclease ABC subunit A